MAIYAGILCCKTQLQLHYRRFFIPWVGKKSAIPCLRNRDYSSSSSSSVPVRYVSNKISEDNPLGSLLDTRVSQGKFFCGLSAVHALKNVQNGDFDEKPQYQDQVQLASVDMVDQTGHLTGDVSIEFMEEPEEVSEDLSMQKGSEEDVMQDTISKKDVENAAIELLAARAFSAVELRKKLCRKKFCLNTIDAVIKDLVKRGLINDSLYAESISRSRWESLSWGPKRIKQALFTKGINAVDAEKAIKLVFEDIDKDQELIHGISKLAMDQLFVQASKQWLRGSALPEEIRKSRIVRWLQYRGFNWGVISFILNKLQPESPPKKRAVKLVPKERDKDEDHLKGRNKDEDQELIHGMSKLSMDRLFVQASNQWLRGRDVPIEIRKSRVIRWLQYRKYNWGVISFLLKKLESQSPP